MNIDVKVKKSPKPRDIIMAQVKFDRDLKSCMRCKFFHGNNSQCITRECVKEQSEQKIAQEEKSSKCLGCPYPQSGRYCFPCMRDILEHDQKENQMIMEQEKKNDG